MVTGRVLAESLRIGVDLTVPDLRVTRVGRHDVSASTAGSQPGVWTFLDLEAPDERADDLARALADALRSDDGWYADFSVGEEHIVVFAGHVFRYRKGDAAARAQAVAYGLVAGTPRHQLDWAE